MQNRAARVAYGSADGLSPGRTVFLDVGVLTEPPDPELDHGGDGVTTAAGDFDGDGYTDLAVGVGQTDMGDQDNAGAVYVTSGSALGLDPKTRKRWTQNSAGVAGAAEANDFFGGALAVGDFDHSGHADLAIGSLYETVSGHEGAGAVHVLPGSPNGLTAANSQWWTAASPGVPGTLRDSGFGTALSAGDFRASGFDDLVIGVPGATVSRKRGAGAVVVLRGGVGGVASVGAQRWTQDSPGIHGTAERDDNLGGGEGLAVGHFAGHAYADLAIGVPAEQLGGRSRAGVVHVLYGSADGLTAKGNQLWSEQTSGIAGQPRTDDLFGIDLAAANFGKDSTTRRYHDLAIGVPGGGASGGGGVHILYGTAAGLTARKSQVWNQDSPGVPGRPQDGDWFGRCLAAANFGANPYADIAVGIPDKYVGPDDISDGAVGLLSGSSHGITGNRSAVWTNLTFGLDPAEAPEVGFGLEAG